MKKRDQIQWFGRFSVTMALCLSVLSPLCVHADDTPGTMNKIFINEIESNDAEGGPDWVEIINMSDQDVDVSGLYITDDKDTERVDEGSTLP